MSQQQQSFRTIGNISITGSANNNTVNLINNQLNTIVGLGAGQNNLSGKENTVVGTNALLQSTGGSGITAVGCSAAQYISSASGAVLIGDRVAPLLSAGFDSVIVGVNAAFNVPFAQGCVMIGPNSGSILANQTCTDVIAIGTCALVSGIGATVVGARSVASHQAAVCVGYCNSISSSGVNIGSLNSSSGPDSIIIGHGLVNSRSDTLIIVAGAGTGNLNIQNVLTGVPDTNGSLHLNLTSRSGTIALSAPHGISTFGGLFSDTITSPSVTVSSPTPTTGNSWTIALAPDAARGTWSDLSLSSGHGTQVTFCDDFEPGLLNFTAQHRCIFQGPDNIRPGSIVISTGRFSGLDGCSQASIDEAIPVVELSSRERDPRVFGVLSSRETDAPSRTFRVGSMGFTLLKQPHNSATRIIVNSSGEGGILVCGANGSVANGDLLVSSACMGVAMTQGDDLIRSCTIAKATCACELVPETGPQLIGCIYLC